MPILQQMQQIKYTVPTANKQPLFSLLFLLTVQNTQMDIKIGCGVCGTAACVWLKFVCALDYNRISG